MQSISRSDGKKQLVSIIIPTFNEEYAIRQVLSLIPYRELEQSEVIVIDGGSSDGTGEIAKTFGADVITQTKPGYAWAIIEAISHAKGDILVFLDGDGVYDPREIPRLLKIMNEEKADLVIGSRFRGEVKPGSIPITRLLGNKLINLSFALLGIRITDPFSGFIVTRKAAVPGLEELRKSVSEPTRYPTLAKVRLRVLLRGGKIIEAPITFYPRREKSKLSPFFGGFRILLSILKLAFSGGLSN
jgi:glycosyltransferase involved in cell wall biosynthesis